MAEKEDKRLLKVTVITLSRKRIVIKNVLLVNVVAENGLLVITAIGGAVTAFPLQNIEHYSFVKVGKL